MDIFDANNPEPNSMSKSGDLSLNTAKGRMKVRPPQIPNCKIVFVIWTGKVTEENNALQPFVFPGQIPDYINHMTGFEPNFATISSETILGYESSNRCSKSIQKNLKILQQNFENFSSLSQNFFI